MLQKKGVVFYIWKSLFWPSFQMRRHYRRHWVVLFSSLHVVRTRTYVQSSPISIINVRFFLFLLQACAPRYVYYIFMGRKDPVGMCFIARNIISRNNFTSIRAHRPCVESGIGCSNFEQIFLICFFFSFPPHTTLPKSLFIKKIRVCLIGLFLHQIVRKFPKKIRKL